MHSEETSQSPIELALCQSMACAKALALIDESLLILSQKRRTLEEKSISRYFHRLAFVYANIISLLHDNMSQDESVRATSISLLYRLRTASENVCNCVSELLKILKYDFNYLEQYFEYDYCARLLINQELLPALEEILSNLQVELKERSSRS